MAGHEAFHGEALYPLPVYQLVGHIPFRLCVLVVERNPPALHNLCGAVLVQQCLDVELFHRTGKRPHCRESA